MNFLSRLHETIRSFAIARFLLVYILTLNTLLRIVLLIYTGSDLVPLSYWPLVLTKGLWFDLVVAAVLITPNVIYETLLPHHWRSTGWHDKIQTVWLFTCIFLLFFGAVSEFTFWVEFSNRLNFIALDYLIYTSEVIGNIRESYPVGWITAVIFAVSLLLTSRARIWIRQDDPPKMNWQYRIASSMIVIVFTGLLIDSASIEQMEDNHNAYASELSGNGLFTLAAAAGRNELDYLKFYRTLPPQTASAVLAQLGVVHPLKSSLRRAEYEHDQASSNEFFSRTPKHLILISVESLSASFLGSYGADKELTPNLDALARGGLKFDNVYATGTRTVRGLEALSLGTPPVPGQAIVRRPHNDHLSTLGEVLKDQNFDAFFFYGGYGYFDNMNHYFDTNDYKVIDRTDIPSNRIVFENVWGVADEALFDTVIDNLDRRVD